MQINESRFRLVVSALTAIFQSHQPADSLLSQFFRDRKSLGGQDRKFVAETIFSVLRRRVLIEHLCRDVTPRRMLLVYLLVLSDLPQASVSVSIKSSEQTWLKETRSIPLDSLPLYLRADLPEWLTKKLAKSMEAAQILALGQALQQPAPLDLRVNTLLSKREAVLQEFAQRDITANPTPYSPLGIRLGDKPALNRDPLFLSGAVEVQDEGSQLLCYLLQVKRREMVVDFCAGAGGKTLALGAIMESQGRIYAFDISEKRIARLKPRLKRSGLSNVYAQLIDGESDAKLKRLRGKIDKVIVDAPCSGFGTLRRNPDLKYRQTAESLSELSEKQFSILNSAANLLKEGGRLVYATCSFLPDENQNVISRFLHRRPEFRILNCGDILKRQQIDLDTGTYLELRPNIHRTDGFFAAALENQRTATT